MRKDSIIFINLADSYFGGGGASGHTEQTENLGRKTQNYGALKTGGRKSNVLKSLDKCNIPHRIAEALRADGWYWRSTVIYSKVNPMPESVRGWYYERCKIKTGRRKATEYKPAGWDTREQSHNELNGNYQNNQYEAEWQDCPGCDKCRKTGGYVLRKGSWRPSTAHEYIFMMTKTSEYFCDGEAVREAYQGLGKPRAFATQGNKDRNDTGRIYEAKDKGGRNFRSVLTLPSSPSNWEFCSGCNTLYAGKDRLKTIKIKDGGSGEIVRFCPKCYRWDSWTNHFAAFSPKLVEPFLKAGTSQAGCCEKCGSPWARIIEHSNMKIVRSERGKLLGKYGKTAPSGMMIEEAKTITLGFRPTCTCVGLDGDSPGSMCADDKNWPSVSMRVLDPFCGSGTTGIVAKSLGLDFVGIDIHPSYAEISRQRIARAKGPDIQGELTLGI